MQTGNSEAGKSFHSHHHKDWFRQISSMDNKSKRGLFDEEQDICIVLKYLLYRLRVKIGNCKENNIIILNNHIIIYGKHLD